MSAEIDEKTETIKHELISSNTEMINERYKQINMQIDNKLKIQMDCLNNYIDNKLISQFKQMSDELQLIFDNLNDQVSKKMKTTIDDFQDKFQTMGSF